MKVMKFGGTSVGNAQNIKQVVGIVEQARLQDEQVLVVCSAMAGVTDELISLSLLAHQGDPSYYQKLDELIGRHESCFFHLFEDSVFVDICEKIRGIFDDLSNVLNGIFLLKECTARSRDIVMSFGERLSTLIVSEALRTLEPSVIMLDARCIVETDGNFGNAHVNMSVTFKHIRQQVGEHRLCVVTGFIASNASGETTTLGRGGSDYTASLFGAALGADEIQIWTDVDGVLTADPRLVAGAQSIEQMSYEEAMEMSHFGAKVIYPPTMQPAREQGIPIVIKNTFNPEHPGTRIVGQTKPNGPVKGISCVKNVALVRVSGSGMVGVIGIAARLFHALAQADINVMMITQGSSEQSICVVLSLQDVKRAAEAINEAFVLELVGHQIDEITVVADLSVIAVVGEHMRHVPGIAGKVFAALGADGVNVIAIAQGSSERNVSIVVSSCDAARGVLAIHEAFFGLLNHHPHREQACVRVYLAGVGQIGSQVLEQLARIAIPFQLAGITNSSVMTVGDLLWDGWRGALQRGEPAQQNLFIKKILEDSARRKIFVDCTSSQEIAGAYIPLLTSGVAIVAANKKAMSGSREMYTRLQPYINRKQFRFETNVCAGLPVISTMQSLQQTGDEILQVEGVLSGTLSYLFNTYDGMGSFAQLVANAKQLGYTEPDPRDDLSGMDVACKLLILARVMGLDLELEDIDVENITPTLCRDVKAEEFLDCLRAYDDRFRLRVDRALAQGQRLRYLAVVKNGRASVQLQAVDPEHPAFRLSGSENFIAVQTRHYYDRPLVIQGPGAGAEVTAAGVISDMFSFL